MRASEPAVENNTKTSPKPTPSILNATGRNHTGEPMAQVKEFTRLDRLRRAQYYHAQSRLERRLRHMPSRYEEWDDCVPDEMKSICFELLRVCARDSDLTADIART